MPTLDDRISIPKEILFREIDGEGVILNVRSGKYFGLEKTIYDFLPDEYDTDRETLERDVVEFVGMLSAKGLLQVNES